MRYYPGIGVGHKYAWPLSQNASLNDGTSSILPTYDSEQEQADIHPEEPQADESREDIDEDGSINSMDGGSRSLEEDSSDDEVARIAGAAEVESEDEEICVHHEMYDSD